MGSPEDSRELPLRLVVPPRRRIYRSAVNVCARRLGEFHSLFDAVMATLAQCLKVVRVKEQSPGTHVANDVVNHVTGFAAVVAARVPLQVVRPEFVPFFFVIQSLGRLVSHAVS